MTDFSLKFEESYAFLMKHEGGLSNDASDPGGITKYGISLRFLKAAGLDIDCDHDIDEFDVIALNKSKSKLIYKKYWWDKYKYENLNSHLIASKIFDLSVNMGAPQCHRLVQRSLCDIGYKVSIDGILGEKSISSLNESSVHDEDRFILSLRVLAAHFYKSLVCKNPELKGFLIGWITRAYD